MAGLHLYGGLRRAIYTGAARTQKRLLSNREVNGLYRGDVSKSLVPGSCKGMEELCKSNDPLCCMGKPASLKNLLKEHESIDWQGSEVREAHRGSSLFGWGVSNDDGQRGALVIEKGEGVFLYDDQGKRYFDFNSSGMCMSLGHTVPEDVVQEITKQLRAVTYTWPDNTITPIRAKLSHLLRGMYPGDLNYFFFPSSGAEANEVAIRAARQVTGRHKILSSYRSYHGGTTATMALTGESRRWTAEMGAHGHVHFQHSFPLLHSHGASEDEIAEVSLSLLREQIMAEGPHTIAAIYLEGVTGTNGTLKHARGFLDGVRVLCNEHGILMICDEVMSGFFRTGRMFGFCHAPGVIPDIVTSAKGFTSAYSAGSVVAVRDHIAERLQSTPLAIGSTYAGHPVALATAYGVIKHMLRHDIVDNVRAMERVTIECMEDLITRHPSIKQARSVGLLGSLDIQKNSAGEVLGHSWNPMHPSLSKFRNALLDNGLWTLCRGHQVFCIPPLIINEDELREAYSIIDSCLPILDEQYTK